MNPPREPQTVCTYRRVPADQRRKKSRSIASKLMSVTHMSVSCARASPAVRQAARSRAQPRRTILLRNVRAFAGRAFDPNDPLTWNVNADDDAGMEEVSGFDDIVANVEDLQSLTDADLAALVGMSGAQVPQMLDAESLAAMREQEAKESAPLTAAARIDQGLKEYASQEYDAALSSFQSALTLPGSGPVRYRKSTVAPAGPSAGFKPRELSAGEEIAIMYNSACCHCRLGNVEEGLVCLKSALERGYDEYGAIRKDADIAELRADPRFEKIMARFEPQGVVGKLFDAMNGPKKDSSLIGSLKGLFNKD